MQVTGQFDPRGMNEVKNTSGPAGLSTGFRDQERWMVTAVRDGSRVQLCTQRDTFSTLGDVSITLPLTLKNARDLAHILEFQAHLEDPEPCEAPLPPTSGPFTPEQEARIAEMIRDRVTGFFSTIHPSLRTFDISPMAAEIVAGVQAARRPPAPPAPPHPSPPLGRG